MKTENRKTRMRPAQRDSGNSILGVLGILGSLGILGWKTKSKTSPAQQDSKMSNVRLYDLSEQSDLLAVRLVPQSGDPTDPKRKTTDNYRNLKNKEN